MAWLSDRLALLPLPALLLMVVGALLTYGSRFWAAHIFRGQAGREMLVKWIGLALIFAGAILVFIQ